MNELMKFIEKRSESSSGKTTMVNIFIDKTSEDTNCMEPPVEPLPPGWTMSKCRRTGRRTGCLYYLNQKLIKGTRKTSMKNNGKTNTKHIDNVLEI